MLQAQPLGGQPGLQEKPAEQERKLSGHCHWPNWPLHMLLGVGDPQPASRGFSWPASSTSRKSEPAVLVPSHALYMSAIGHLPGKVHRQTDRPIESLQV
jgi:hypothetical protein